MSNEAITWAYRQRTGNVGRKAVLVALADKAFNGHEVVIDQSTLAAMTDQSERSVRQHLADLEKLGFIGREHRYSAGRRVADRYTLPVAVAVSMHKPLEQPADAAGTTDLPANPAADLPAESVTPTGESRRAIPLTHPQDAPSVPAAAAKPPAKATKAAARGTRIPEDWKRTPADIAWQHREEIPDEFARPVTLEFVSYWTAASGRTATKLNWSAAWKGWMSREWREKGARWRRDNGTGRGTSEFDARAAAALARARDPLASAR